MIRWGEANIMRAVLILWHIVLIANTSLMVAMKTNSNNGCYEEIFYLPGVFFSFACGTEFAIYMLICLYVYKNDIKMRQFISSETYGKRKRRNAFNLFGHSIHFLIELLIMCLLSIWRTKFKIPPKVGFEFTSTVLAISMLLLSKPMKIKWTQLFKRYTDKTKSA